MLVEQPVRKKSRNSRWQKTEGTNTPMDVKQIVQGKEYYRKLAITGYLSSNSDNIGFSKIYSRGGGVKNMISEGNQSAKAHIW